MKVRTTTMRRVGGSVMVAVSATLLDVIVGQAGPAASVEQADIGSSGPV